MEIKTKKGFGFTFLSIFVVIVIFAMAQNSFQDIDYTKNKGPEFQRLQSLNEEFKYFTERFFVDSLRLSIINSTLELIEKSKDNNFRNIYVNNYSKLNDLLLEGVLNSSFQGVPFSASKENTIGNLIDPYKENLFNSKKVILNYSLISLNIFEKTPFYLTFQVNANISFRSLDNIGVWYEEKKYFISFPLFNVKNPLFYIVADLPRIQSPYYSPIELFSSSSNWDIDLFNRTILNGYGVSYFDPEYKYSLGNSFLDALFNITSGSYRNKLFFMSFDYDYDEKIFGYETTGKIINASFKDSKLLYLNFNENLDDSSFNPFEIESNNIIYGRGVIDNSSVLNGIDSFIKIKNSINNKLSQINDSFSISFWIKSNFSQPIEKPMIFLSSNLVDQFGFYFFNNINLDEEESSIINIICPPDNKLYNFNLDLLDNDWNNIIINFNFKTMKGEIFSNGIFKSDFNLPNSCKNNNFGGDLFVGNYSSDYLNASIDDFLIINRDFSNLEIAEILEKKNLSFIDYSSSLNKESISMFNGSEFFINLSDDKIDLSSEYSLSFWLFPENTNSGEVITLGNLDSSEILKIYLEADSLIFKKGAETIKSNIINNRWNYFSISTNSSGTEIYFNGNKINSSPDNYLFSSDLSYIWISNSSNGFSGMFDELLIKNETTSFKESGLEYFNYESYVKGCCNTVSLISPNDQGFNNPSYLGNHSYYSNLFFRKFIFNEELRNLTLYSMDGITSNNINAYSYNFLIDPCMAEIYDIFSYSPDDNIINIVDSNPGSCKDLIRWGYY